MRVPSRLLIALLSAFATVPAHAWQQAPTEVRQPASLHWQAYSQQPASQPPVAQSPTTELQAEMYPQTSSQATSLRWQSFAQSTQTQAPASVPTSPKPKVEATSDYMQRMDIDRDGRVSRTEYVDWMSYAFDARDLDHDGVLAPSEQPGGQGQSITREQHRERLAERFGKQDANHDGYLDATELAAPPQ